MTRAPLSLAVAAEVLELDDGAGLRVQLSPLGACWLGAQLHGRELLLRLGPPELQAAQPGFVGGIVGRYANRIAGARFTVDGLEHRLPSNEGANLLHGGPPGFHRRLWAVREHRRDLLRLALHSPDGEQGFPGALDVELRYELPAPGHLRLAWSLRCSRACPVNLTSHAYFNLDGDGLSIEGHRLQVDAEQMVPVGPDGLPSGEPVAVDGSRFDLRAPRPACGVDGLGFDHNFCMRPGGKGAQLRSADGRVALQLDSDLPGLQVYSGDHLPEALRHDGRPTPARAGLALEPQYWPDSPNHPTWPQALVRPGQVQAHRIDYRFRRLA